MHALKTTDPGYLLNGGTATVRPNPWADGFRLAALNGALAILCSATFLGVVQVATLASTWWRSVTGNPSVAVPFPVPLLLLAFAVALIVAWVRFARGLVGTRRQALQVALVGTSPLFGLSLLGYASTLWTLAFRDAGANGMLNATVWVSGTISTLVLLAGVSCVAVITFIAQRGIASPSS